MFANDQLSIYVVLLLGIDKLGGATCVKKFSSFTKGCVLRTHTDERTITNKRQNCDHTSNAVE